jgi:hypothetical protein
MSVAVGHKIILTCNNKVKAFLAFFWAFLLFVLVYRTIGYGQRSL